MEVASKDFSLGECDNQFAQPCSSDGSTHQLTEASALEDTLEIVKEKFWSFTGALKGVADVLIGFGLNPSILGYSSVPLHEDEYIKEKSEDEASLQKIAEDEILSGKLGCGSRLNENVHHRRSSEEANLLHRREEDDYVNHAFCESMHRESDERKSLTRSASWESMGNSEFDEDKKEK